MIAPSGDVPRDLRPGILWGPAEEALFVERVAARLKQFPWIADDPAELDQTRRSALWSVENEVITAVLHAKIREGLATEDGHRSAFLNRLRLTHGDLMADSVMTLARSTKYKRLVMERRV